MPIRIGDVGALFAGLTVHWSTSYMFKHINLYTRIEQIVYFPWDS